jgi:hypothetical protein
MEVVEKLDVDPFKITINKKVCDDLLEQAKNLACNQILKRKGTSSKKIKNNPHPNQSTKKDNVDKTN